MTDPVVLAPPMTVLGLLQRGRGLGLQLARGTGRTEARAGLLKCLRQDPRWDAQVETRDLYYADVATTVDVPATEIHGILRDLAATGDATRYHGQYLVAGVLGVLATRGDRQASDALVREVREGPAWHVAIEEVHQRTPEETWRSLGETLFARLSDEEIQRLAEGGFRLDPWRTWEHGIERYKQAVHAVRGAHDAGRGSDAGPASGADTRLSTPALLQIVAPRTWRAIARVLEARRDPADTESLRAAVRQGPELQQAVALQALSAIGDPGLLEEALAILRATDSLPLRIRAARYLAAAPPALTLERARTWLGEPWPLLLAGREVLEHHATVEDEDMLRATLVRAVAEGDMYAACFALNALGCFDARSTRPEIRDAYESMPYAYGRVRAARALARIEHDFARATAVECLYDCEAQGRRLGIRHADRSLDDVRQRLEQLATDPAECDDVGSEAEGARHASHAGEA